MRKSFIKKLRLRFAQPQKKIKNKYSEAERLVKIKLKRTAEIACAAERNIMCQQARIENFYNNVTKIK